MAVEDQLNSPLDTVDLSQAVPARGSLQSGSSEYRDWSCHYNVALAPLCLYLEVQTRCSIHKRMEDLDRLMLDGVCQAFGYPSEYRHRNIDSRRKA